VKQGQWSSKGSSILVILLFTSFCRPNDNFLAQLEIFYKASCKVSMHDKATRMFYLERMVKGIISKF
jgi:hypothetical protein